MKHLKFFVVLNIVLLTLFSCQKDDGCIMPPSTDTKSSNPDGMVQLGKKLENPYSLKNMRKALKELKQAGFKSSVNMAEQDLQPTHLYVKFIPKNEEELDLLKVDTTLILYDYPLDYEIEEGGSYYRDPAVPEGQPTYQYAAVEVDKTLPKGVAYEILDEAFMLDEDEIADSPQRKSSPTSDIDWLALETKAYEITGNLEEEDSLQTKGFFSRLFKRGNKWHPAGRIRVYDHVTHSYVGVSGVKVRARAFLKTRYGYTDNNGNYRFAGTFRGKANYDIKWDRHHFSIRSAFLVQAIFNGPKRKGDWSVDLGYRNSIGVKDKQQYFALIHQAALDYYYGGRFGLSSPPRNNTLKPQIKILAYQTDRKKSHVEPYFRTLGILPTIYIRKWGLSSDRIYGVTIHELAHMAHWDMDRNAFRSLALKAYIISKNKSCQAVIESWATGVEWALTTYRYRNKYRIPSYKYRYNLQYKKLAGYTENQEDLIYTSIIVDLMDNENQRYRWGIKYPMDRVSGYTIKQIENALRGARSWNQFRDRVKNINPSNHDNAQIDELFANWYN